MSFSALMYRFKDDTKPCGLCGGSGQIMEITEHRGGWVYKPRRCDECKGFGQVAS
jgi:DnaJ-class molecular chaperone